jgi:hypothetical protein
MGNSTIIIFIRRAINLDSNFEYLVIIIFFESPDHSLMKDTLFLERITINEEILFSQNKMMGIRKKGKIYMFRKKGPNMNSLKGP